MKVAVPGLTAPEDLHVLVYPRTSGPDLATPTVGRALREHVRELGVDVTILGEGGVWSFHPDASSVRFGAYADRLVGDRAYSRPRVSDDNPYSEALFRTLKYCPEYPTKPFVDVADARTWVLRFVTWYNGTHLHSGVRFVTPNARHAGKNVVILAERVKVYEAARAKNPARWTMSTRNWTPVDEVYLNPDKPQSKLRNAHALKRVVKHVAKENTLADRGSRAAPSATHTLNSKRATESSAPRVTPSAQSRQERVAAA